MFSSGRCGRPRVLKRHSTRHRFEVLSRKKLIKIKRVLNLSEEPVRDTGLRVMDLHIRWLTTENFKITKH